MQRWCLLVLLVIVMLGLSPASEAATVRVQTSQVAYVGAFRLVSTIGAYGAGAIAWDPTGDGGAGHLIVHNADFSDAAAAVRPPTPQPLGSITSWSSLPQATTLITPTSVTGGLYGGGGQVQISSLAYYKSGAHPAKLCFSIMDYYNTAPNPDNTLGCNTPLGTASSTAGLWASNYSPNRTGGHIFQVPTSVATRWGSAARDLCFGFTRSSGAFGGGQGAQLICGNPWASGDTMVDGESRTGPETPLPNDLELIGYSDFDAACSESGSGCEMPGYTGVDNWVGAQYISIGGTEAVIFAGVKCTSNFSYYCPSQGWHCGPNPGGSNCTDSPYIAQLKFYDVDQIGQVAANTLEPNEIIPYATWTIPTPFEITSNNNYDWYGDLAYDQVNQRLYVNQRWKGPDAQPVIHVLQLSGSGGGEDVLAPRAPENLRATSP